MKKNYYKILLSLSLALLLLFITACSSDNVSDNKSSIGKNHLIHVGVNTCSECGIDYYQEVKKYILDRGATDSQWKDYKAISVTKGNLDFRMRYYEGNEKIILSTSQTDKGTTVTTFIYIPDAGGKYTWQTNGGGGYIQGDLNANNFSISGGGLTYSDTSYSSSLINSVLEYSRDKIDICINCFNVLLNDMHNGIDVKNFGFVNY